MYYNSLDFLDVVWEFKEYSMATPLSVMSLAKFKTIRNGNHSALASHVRGRVTSYWEAGT